MGAAGRRSQSTSIWVAAAAAAHNFSGGSRVRAVRHTLVGARWAHINAMESYSHVSRGPCYDQRRRRLDLLPPKLLRHEHAYVYAHADTRTDPHSLADTCTRPPWFMEGGSFYGRETLPTSCIFPAAGGRAHVPGTEFTATASQTPTTVHCRVPAVQPYCQP